VQEGQREGEGLLTLGLLSRSLARTASSSGSSGRALAVALGAAVEAGSVAAARVLLAAGADPLAPCEDADCGALLAGRSALDRARDLRHFGLIKALSSPDGASSAAAAG